jgi:hypothetical protein
VALVPHESAVLSGRGLLLFGEQPAALELVTTNIPAWLGSDMGESPSYLPWLARIALGNLEGFFLPTRRVRKARQLIEELPDYLDRMTYEVQTGATCTVTVFTDSLAGGATTAQVAAAASRARIKGLLSLGM